MPSFDDVMETPAPPEEVWKALYDPARFPEWWAGLATVTQGDAKGGDGDITIYPDGYPDFPMPQQLTTRTINRQVIVSCMVSDLVFDWRLEPLGGDAGTRITVHVEIPEHEAARLPAQRAIVAQSLRNLAVLATG